MASTRLAKVLLILPCNGMARVGDYRLGRGWRAVLKAIRPWRERGVVELAAVECIDMLGLVHEDEAYLVKGKEEYPAWSDFRRSPEKLLMLKEAVKKRLRELAPRYDYIVAHVNVRAYYLALKEASEELGIPVRFTNIERFSPMAFSKGIKQVVSILEEICPLRGD